MGAKAISVARREGNRSGAEAKRQQPQSAHKKADQKIHQKKAEQKARAKALALKKVSLEAAEVKRKKAAAPLDEKAILAERHALIVDNYESGKRLAWSFLNRWRVRIEEDEVTSITGAALCEAAQRFKKELGVNFRTFLFYYLRGMLLKEITRRVQDQKFRAPMIQSFQEANDDARGVSLENFVAPHAQVHEEFRNPEEILERKETLKLCREATQGLDVLEQKVLERFFAEDESVVDIAKSLGYCRCHISRVKSKALSTLSEKLEVLNPEASDDELLSSQPLNRKRNYRGVRGRRKTGEPMAA